MTLGEVLAEAKSAEAPRRTRKRVEVPRGPEFQRVRALRRRAAPDVESQEAKDLAEMLTTRMAKKPDPYPGRLSPTQAVGLREGWTMKGLVGLLRAGSGKTLLFYLIGSVLGAKRILYVTEAGLLDSAQKEFAKMSRDWHGPALSSITMESYEVIAHPDRGEVLAPNGEVLRKAYLELLKPDLIILDECQNASNDSTTRDRFQVFVDNNPQCLFVVGSGTFFRKSIKDGVHLMEWALKDKVPFPTDFTERETWCSQLDVTKSALKAGVGALVDFLEGDERRQFNRDITDSGRRSILRKAVARWMFDTPGILGTKEPLVDVPIYMNCLHPLEEDTSLEEHFKLLRCAGVRPDGVEIADQMQIAHVADCMGQGIYQKWDPPPPPEWRAARDNWSRWCREMLKHNKRRIDSEAKMKDAVRKGLYDDQGALRFWEEERQKEIFRTGHQEPPSIAVWLTREIVPTVRAWVEQHPKGIVWTKYTGIARVLSTELGLDYYGEQGLNKNGRFIEDHPGGPIIASVWSNGVGRNLQWKWHDNLWICMPGEQQLARTHRLGQKHAVGNWIYIGCIDHLKSYYYATEEKAAFAADFQGADQRLLHAEADMPTMEDLYRPGSYRWVLRGKDGAGVD